MNKYAGVNTYLYTYILILKTPLCIFKITDQIIKIAYGKNCVIQHRTRGFEERLEMVLFR